MKKVLRILFQVFSIVLFLFSSCAKEPATPSFKGSVTTRDIQFEEEEEETLKNELIFYSLANNYKLTDEAINSDLTSFLCIKDDKNEKYDSSRNINSEINSSYKINKLRTISKKIAKYNTSSRTVDSTENITINVVSFTSQSDFTSGIAVTSDDERLGSILCILDGTELDKEEKNPVLDIFLQNLDGYVEEIDNELISITENDIDSFKEKYNITDEEIEIAKLNYLNSEACRKFWGYDSWSSWSPSNSNLSTIIYKTKWDQSSPYNSAITAMEGDDYLTGCGATAVAQLMAYHNWPTFYNRNDLQILKNKWPLASNWTGEYDWSAMTANPDANKLSPNGLLGVGALMYEVSKGCKSDYGTSATSSTMSNRILFLRNNGYKCDNEKKYSYNAITKSLSSNSPVMARGSTADGAGHAWIIDGSLKLMRSRNYYVFWIPFACKEQQDFVHCNYGWSGKSDTGVAYSYNGVGFYKSSVFSTSNGDYSSSLKICTNIKPKK